MKALTTNGLTELITLIKSTFIDKNSDVIDVSDALASVAISGSYNDLSNKPTIPTVNNATLTIQKNGTTVNSFTANASSDVTANITVPTKVSDLTNDSGYTTNVGTVTSVNNTSPDSNGNVTISIPSEVTESTVSGWGFTKNTGTVTSVNNVSPVNGNVTLTIPDTSNLANKDLSNLSTNGNNRLHALKSYKDAGELLTDSEGLTDVNYYAHSTFDRSKFTVVGNPSITEDGIVSGFSSSNYLTVPISFDKPFKLSMAFTTGNSFNTPQYLLITSARGLQVLLGSGGNFRVICGSTSWGTDILNYTGSNSLSTNTNYLFELEFTGSKYNARLNNNLLTSVDSTSKINTDTSANIGSYSSQSWQGSIDLKQFSITVDEVEVFSGNKTGIDTIKPDNYTVVGTPTISAEGVASGFSSSNVLEIPAFTPSDKPWEISLSFTMGSSAGYLFACGKPGNNPIRGVRLNASSSSLALGLSYNGTTLGDSLTASCLLINGNKYNVSIKFTKDGYYQVWLDGVKIGQTNSSKNAIWNSTADKFYIGAMLDANVYKEYFRGTIDLNSFKIYVDGNLVYQPCLKIPYTESKTGSKIVGSIYRDRVNDMAEQFGYANYYTLSDTDFTLPQCEVYGLIGQRTLRDSYRNGINYWEIYSNRDLEQGGSCTSGVEVTFARPFEDTNYVLSVPYSAKSATAFTPTQTGDWIAKGKGLL